MNILIMTGIFPHYSQTYVIDQINTLRGLNAAYNIEVACVRDTGMRPSNAPPEVNDTLVSAKPFNTKMARNIIRNVFRRPAHMAKVTRLRFSVKLPKKTIKIAAQLQRDPDLIVLHFGNHSDMAAQMKRYLFPRAKVVVVLHGHDVSSFVKKRKGWRLYRGVAKDVDTFVSINKVWKDRFAEHVPEANVEVCYLGTTVPDTRREAYGVDGSASILAVGRHVEKKGIDILLNALAGALKKNPNIKLNLIGDGPLTPDLQLQVEEMGLSNNVSFLGSVPHDAVITWIAQSDIFALPSRTAEDGDAEGLPVALMEAMAQGIPVVSTYHSGIPELVEHDVNGLLVEEGNSEQLADAILELTASADLRKRLGQSGYETVKERHEHVTQTQAFVNLVLSTAGEPRVPKSAVDTALHAAEPH